MSNPYWRCDESCWIIFGLLAYKRFNVSDGFQSKTVRRVYLLRIPVFSREERNQ